MLVLKILKNRNFIFVLSIILGLSVGNIGDWIKHLTIPALAIVIIVSLTQIPLKTFLQFKNLVRPTLYAILFNYLIFGAVILILAWFLIKDQQIWIGFVLLACAPPGVAIVPFTY